MTATEKTRTQASLTFTSEDWQNVFTYVRKNPAVLFFDSYLRNYVARKRAAEFGRTQKWSEGGDDIAGFAVGYNAHQMEKFLESHVVRLIRPLSILDPVYDKASALQLLSVGPRNENEIYHLIAHGFRLENITAIDLVSNGPLVQIADMHDLPFDDGAFDIAVSGWTLPYSRNPKRALAEHVRVLNRGGLLCLGLTRVPPGTPEAAQLDQQGCANYTTADQILDDIGRENVADVAFRHEPMDLSQKGAILLIVRIKK